MEGMSVSDGTEVADAINKYFYSIAKKLDDEIPYTQNSEVADGGGVQTHSAA